MKHDVRSSFLKLCLTFFLLEASASCSGEAKPRRPQEPKPPYPYLQTEVHYENARASATLAGTLTFPKGDGPFPAVLLIAGSGRLTRDEVVANHKIFLVLADSLTRRGLAVLRVDKRGVGASTGDYSLATSEDFADDVLAGIEFLKGRKEIDPRRIGLAGHSEGGIVGPMVANRSQDVAFVVALGGPAVLGEKVMTEQAALIGEADGDSAETLAKVREIHRRFHEFVRKGEDRETLAKRLRELMKELPARNQKQIEGSFEVPISPWYRFFIDYDPAPALMKLRCPILFFIGEKDLQVPAKENLDAAERALRDGRNPDFAVKTMPGINHALQRCKTGAPSEYGAIEETIAPPVLALIGDWIIERTARAQPGGN